MKRIEDYCLERRNHAEQHHPFIQWLRDDSVPHRDRLGRWLPFIAGFAMSFRDLNNIVLPYPDAEASQDPLKASLNRHFYQDGTHWQWYLKDLKRLAVDIKQPFMESLHYIWQPETDSARQFIYSLCALIDEAQDPRLRYAVVEPIEQMAHLLFGETAKLAQRLEHEKGIALEYVGMQHSGHEPGGLVNQGEDADPNPFSSIVLEEPLHQRALEICKYVADETEKRWMTNFQYVTSHETWLVKEF